MSSVIRIQKDGSKDGLIPCAAVPPEAVIGGDAIETGETMYESTNVSIGCWESTPYTEILECGEHTEFCYILKGKVALTNPDGTTEVFENGDSFILPSGWKGRFEVLEDLRKLYVVSMDTPKDPP